MALLVHGTAGRGAARIGLLVSTVRLAGLEFWAPRLGEIAQTGTVIIVMAAVGGLVADGQR
ncbi:hypothetical protein [Nocardia pseudovaccinii]|uniref:hypothetical protein n=1 Tax=Nocardia pseudovaccinii TaxID=189540 RepID=UPI0007A5388A|nr:hypothetical protein [Nocardia pseudovaccinii]